jgi:hypothetical protein
MSRAASSSMTVGLKSAPQNSLNQRPTIALLLSSVLMGILSSCRAAASTDAVEASTPRRPRM